MNIPICFKLRFNYYLNFVFPNKVKRSENPDGAYIDGQRPVEREDVGHHSGDEIGARQQAEPAVVLPHVLEVLDHE